MFLLAIVPQYQVLVGGFPTRIWEGAILVALSRHGHQEELLSTMALVQLPNFSALPEGELLGAPPCGSHFFAPLEQHISSFLGLINKEHDHDHERDMYCPYNEQGTS